MGASDMSEICRANTIDQHANDLDKFHIHHIRFAETKKVFTKHTKSMIAINMQTIQKHMMCIRMLHFM